MREAKLTEPQIQVRMDRVRRDEVDEFRRKHPGLPSRPGAIRELVKKALRQDGSTGNGEVPIK